jgi:hypothetical protein
VHAVDYARYADDLVILVDGHRRHDWLLRAVQGREGYTTFTFEHYRRFASDAFNTGATGTGVVLPIDQGDPDIGVPERLRGGQAAEAPAHDHDARRRIKRDGPR